MIRWFRDNPETIPAFTFLAVSALTLFVVLVVIL